jgi:hypothetical protein
MKAVAITGATQLRGAWWCLELGHVGRGGTQAPRKAQICGGKMVIAQHPWRLECKLLSAGSLMANNKMQVRVRASQAESLADDLALHPPPNIIAHRHTMCGSGDQSISSKLLSVQRSSYDAR